MASRLLGEAEEVLHMARSDENQDKRAGEVLGLGDVTPGDSGIPHASNNPDEVRRRRARMHQGADSLTAVESEMPHGGGATGVDMGAGGQGTDIEE
jgi:hypothetical protein